MVYTWYARPKTPPSYVSHVLYMITKHPELFWNVLKRFGQMSPFEVPCMPFLGSLLTR